MRNHPVRMLIVGAGGHAAEMATYVLDLLQDGWSGSFLGFLDDLVPPPTMKHGQVLGMIESFRLPEDTSINRIGYIVAVGQNRIRKQIVERIEKKFGSAMFALTVAHPRAYLGRDVEIGEGTLLAPGSLATARVSLGRHVILNVKASVSHDVVIGDYATINPAATICGNVKVGEGAFIGAGAVVKEQVSVGSWSIVGAGAVVINDIPPFSVAVGVPARVIKSLAEPRRDMNACR